MNPTYPEGRLCLVDTREEVQLKPESNIHFVTAVHVRRNRLKDLVSDRRARTVKGNSSPNYSPQAPINFWARVNDTRQHLPTRVGGYTDDAQSYSLRNTQSHPQPFESGPGVLPGLEKFAEINRSMIANYRP